MENILKTKETIEITKLTKREYETLKYIQMGYSNPEIARIMFVSINTIKAHISSILRKLNVKNRVQAAVWYELYKIKNKKYDKKDE